MEPRLESAPQCGDHQACTGKLLLFLEDDSGTPKKEGTRYLKAEENSKFRQREPNGTVHLDYEL